MTKLTCSCGATVQTDEPVSGVRHTDRTYFHLVDVWLEKHAGCAAEKWAAKRGTTSLDSLVERAEPMGFVPDVVMT